MQGNLEIYQGYSNTEELIFSENNIVVDGAKEHIAEVMTYYPSPSAVSASVSSTYDAENHNVKAWSIAPARGSWYHENSRASLSGYNINYSGSIPSPSAVFSALDSSTGYYNLLPYPAGYNFSTVNVPGSYYYNTGTSAQALLENHDFSSAIDYGMNHTFSSYYLDSTSATSGLTAMNEALKLFTPVGYDVSSTLRYFTSGDDFNDNYPHGSFSIAEASTVPGISDVSADVPSGVNVAFIRSFATSANPATSGAVHVACKFVIPNSDFSRRVFEDPVLKPLGFLSFGIGNLTSNSDCKLKVALRDLDTKEFYNFDSHKWDTSESNLVVDGASFLGSYGNLGRGFNITSSRLNDRLETRYSFYSSATDTLYRAILGEPRIRVLEGWKYGHIASGDVISPTSGGGLKMWKTNPVYNPHLSGTTYIAQSFSGMVPDRGYYYHLDASTNHDSRKLIRYHLLQKESLVGDASSNAAMQIGFSSLNEYRSDSRTGSPYLPLGYVKNITQLFDRPPKPSEKCVNIVGASSLNGSGLVRSGAKYTLGISPWIGYPPEETGCGTRNYTVGDLSSLVVLKSPIPGEDDVYYQWSSETWGPSSVDSIKHVNAGIDASSVGFSSMSYAVKIPSTFNTWQSSSNLTVQVQLRNDSTASIYFKDFSLIGPYLDYASDKISQYNFLGTTTTDLWGNVNPAITLDVDSSSFSGLHYDQLYVQNPYAVSSDTSAVLSNTSAVVPVEGFNEDPNKIHSTDSEYQFIVSLVSGSANTSNALFLQSVGMGDTGTAFVPSSSYDMDLPTSETEGVVHGMEDTGRFMVRPKARPTEAWTARRTLMKSKLPYQASAFPANIAWGLDPNSTNTSHNIVSLEYCDYLSSLLLEKEDKVSFGFEFNILHDNTSGLPGSTVSSNFVTQAFVEDEKGSLWVYNWDSSSFTDATASGATVVNFTMLPCARQGYDPLTINDMKSVFSDPIKLDLDSLGASSKLKVSVAYRPEAYLHRIPWAINNFRFYKVNIPPPRDFPEFPNPYDRYVQTPTDGEHSKFGHYPNYLGDGIVSSMGSFSGTSGVTLERSYMYGAYPPASGITFSGHTLSGMLNRYGLVNSEGYILQNRGVPDASSQHGFTVSAGDSAIQYELTLSSTDYNYVTSSYAGVGAIGLWTYDFPKTAKKLKDAGYALSAGILDTSATPYATSVYNVTDLSRNPIYRLFAKKVFTPGGLIMDSSADYIRMKWTITF